VAVLASREAGEDNGRVSTPETPGEQPEFARGGLLPGPDGEDSIPVLIYPGEHWYTAEQVRRFMAAKPGSRDTLS
jgi:hypothetical protein